MAGPGVSGFRVVEDCRAENQLIEQAAMLMSRSEESGLILEGAVAFCVCAM